MQTASAFWPILEPGADFKRPLHLSTGRTTVSEGPTRFRPPSGANDPKRAEARGLHQVRTTESTLPYMFGTYSSAWSSSIHSPSSTRITESVGPARLQIQRDVPVFLALCLRQPVAVRLPVIEFARESDPVGPNVARDQESYAHQTIWQGLFHQHVDMSSAARLAALPTERAPFDESAETPGGLIRRDVNLQPRLRGSTVEARANPASGTPAASPDRSPGTMPAHRSTRPQPSPNQSAT